MTPGAFPKTLKVDWPGDSLRFWLLCGGIFGLAGGAIAPLTGALLIVTSWVTESAGAMHSTGSILICATMPLLIFGGCCLDWYERRAQKAND